MVRREACIVNLESKLRRLSRDSGSLDQVGWAGRVGGAERGWAGPKPGASHAGGSWPASPPPTWPLFRHAQAEVHPFRPHPEEKSVPLSLTRVSGVRSRNLILWLEMQEETRARPLASWATADEHPVASAPSHVTQPANGHPSGSHLDSHRV